MLTNTGCVGRRIVYLLLFSVGLVRLLMLLQIGAPVGLVGAVRLVAVVFIGSLRPGLVRLLMPL